MNVQGAEENRDASGGVGYGEWALFLCWFFCFFLYLFIFVI